MDIQKKTKNLARKKSPTKPSPATSVKGLKRSGTRLGDFEQLQQAVEVFTKLNNGNITSPKMLKMDKAKPIPDTSSEIPEEPSNKPDSLIGSHTPNLDAIEKTYPLLTDSNLISKFMAVPMTNNQKGRIRQLIREDLKSNYQGSENGNFDPRILNQKIQAIISKRDALTESDLRKIRILHNMLRFSTQPSSLVNLAPKKKKNKKSKNKKRKMKDRDEVSSDITGLPSTEVQSNFMMAMDVEKPVLEPNVEDIEKVGTHVEVEKVKGPKRYVVFLGNLPYLTDKDKIKQHFIDITDDIKDIRIPKLDNKKGGIAYLELGSESSFQLALSKHHSMMENRRINVLYTTAGKKKMDMSDIKVKRAKLLALQKTGKLLGSIPQNKKRSFRRKKQREAIAASQAV